MISHNAYVYPGSDSAASFVSPLMDCTSAIHNSDNIQNASHYFTSAKSAATVAFQERLKGLPLTLSEPQSPFLPQKRANDPYRRTSMDGSPCIPKSPYPTEVSFRMAYKEEGGSVFDAVPSTPILTQHAPLPQGSCSVQSTIRTSCHPLPQQHPRSALSPQFNYRVPTFAAGSSSAPAFLRCDPNRNTPNVATVEVGSSNKKERRVEQRNARANAQTQLQPATPSATSVTHVRCKRVYVNGRPVTVWLNAAEQAQ
ncbi:hypothetical protein DQ04_02251110 [Trypanosoma grayi]|uniref:hypothetical protein n=1 Tax=Trypanosoma grayi TaxID=71804 RepID=UPI0004F449E7|nr:hypothetical protein DQ04_02251110 [Trypanosoma grayi]KEG11821.1 hypothetical protein DQ04_02251110 [Trypanosoma grayi]